MILPKICKPVFFWTIFRLRHKLRRYNMGLVVLTGFWMFYNLMELNVESICTSRELTISKFPKKWLRYSCMATFARSEIECWRPRAGRMTGRTAIEGTFLPQQVQCLAYCMHGITYGDSTALNQHFRFWQSIYTSITRASSIYRDVYLFLIELSSSCEGTFTSSASSSSCTTGILSPIPKFWSHSLTFSHSIQKSTQYSRTEVAYFQSYWHLSKC
jgi:hypothetical protein